MSPFLAHIHTVRSVQFREFWWTFMNEFFVFYSGHGVTLFRLRLLTFLVPARSLLLLIYNLLTPTSGIRRVAIGSMPIGDVSARDISIWKGAVARRPSCGIAVNALSFTRHGIGGGIIRV